MAIRKLKPIEERDPYAAAVLEAFDNMEPSSLATLNVGAFDPFTDTITIEGTRYSGCLFRDGFGLNAMVGQVLRIDKHEDGVVTITRMRDMEAPNIK